LGQGGVRHDPTGASLGREITLEGHADYIRSRSDGEEDLSGRRKQGHNAHQRTLTPHWLVPGPRGAPVGAPRVEPSRPRVPGRAWTYLDVYTEYRILEHFLMRFTAD
jgi:hypothetical protein